MPEDLSPIFEELKKMLEKYSPPLKEGLAASDKAQYHVWSRKPAVVAGRKKKEIYFAGIIAQKDYVGLYFMPVYTDRKIRGMLGADLLKLLRGKSCFHIRELTPKLKYSIREGLDAGFGLYKKRGWI